MNLMLLGYYTAALASLVFILQDHGKVRKVKDNFWSTLAHHTIVITYITLMMATR